ncbi:MAG: 3'-5' exonuclease [Lachnospiraceae bacterium]|jgi:DNA polymerase-3 subunit epsilon|nr:3'-5' exonuclease [Lachnospiraceae bacterium]
MVNTYIALDLETTGLNPSRDRILEIGAVKVVEGQIADTYENLVNPGRSIGRWIEELTGITEEMARTGRDTGEALRELLEFCGNLPLLGHNIIFDYSFIKQNAVNLNLEFEREGIDTLKIARALFPEMEHRSLQALVSYYQIPQEQAHRAASDALSAMELYRRMREDFPDSPEELFKPKPLVYSVKKQGPITPAQKGYLNDLLKYHKIALEMSVDSLTKNEASRIIDRIILEYGRIQR